MQDISLYIILNYIYHYALTFFICLLGAFIKDCYETIVKNNTKIKISRVLISALFSSVVLCAIDSYIDIKFSIYVFISVFFGLWGFNILEIILNSTIVLNIIKNVFRNITSPITRGISDTITEIRNNTNNNRDNNNPGT